LILGCAVLYYLVGSKLIPVPQNIVELTRRFLRGAVLIVIVLAIAKAISIYAIGRLDDAAARFTLRRMNLHPGATALSSRRSDSNRRCHRRRD
jgi:hypothetical protein